MIQAVILPSDPFPVIATHGMTAQMSRQYFSNVFGPIVRSVGQRFALSNAGSASHTTRVGMLIAPTDVLVVNVPWVNANNTKNA